MKNYLITFLFSCSFLPLLAQAQNEAPQKGFQKDKLFLSGNFGLSFGDYTIINISPQLGYRFTRYFAAGAGVKAQYISLKERYNGDPYRKTSQGVGGLNIFGRVYPIERIMLQVQPEANYVFGKEIFYGPPRQDYTLQGVIAPSLLAGAGVVFPSGRGAFIASAFYDVLQDKNSPYGKRPFINFGFNMGL